MKKVLIAGEWINVPEPEDIRSGIYFPTEDLKIIEEAMNRYKQTEAEATVGFGTRKNIGNAERILSVIRQEIMRR